VHKGWFWRGAEAPPPNFGKPLQVEALAEPAALDASAFERCRAVDA
jgi:hypothetical protein